MEKENHSYNRTDDDVCLLQCHDADGSAHSAESTSTSPLEAAGIGLGMGGDHLAIVHPLGRDHRKVMVRVGESKALHAGAGVWISDTDFTDDRLAIVLRQLSQDNMAIIEQTSAEILRIYDLPVQQVRLDATTMSGYHLVDEEGCFSLDIVKTTPVCLSSKRCWQT